MELFYYLFIVIVEFLMMDQSKDINLQSYSLKMELSPLIHEWRFLYLLLNNQNIEDFIII